MFKKHDRQEVNRPDLSIREIFSLHNSLPRRRPPVNGGGERDRTDDLLRAKQALSQLSYTPFSGIRGQGSGARRQEHPDPWLLVPDT